MLGYICVLIFFVLLGQTPDVYAGKIITVDGSDSAGIAAAIAQSNAGDTVFLPARKYAVKEAIRPKTGTRLEGAGTEETILAFEGQTKTAMVCLSGVEDIEVCKLTLDACGNPCAEQGIAASDARRLNLHHLTIRNFTKGQGFGPHGILCAGTNPSCENGVTDSEVADCHIENIAPDATFGGGIRFSWGSSRNRILRNVVSNTGRGGIFADNGSNELIIQGNTVSGSHGEGLGIEVWGGCDRCVIEDNIIDHWLSIGGCDYCAARRNVISDKSGEYTFCGIEGIGSYCVITDNTVDGGQKIGLSVSGTQPKNYVFWGRNTVRGCNQWGAQFQGESGGIACHYLYRCVFTEMPTGEGPVWYPGDEGHGFRTNGQCRNLTFEECQFSGNGRLGLQLGGDGIDGLRFVRCEIKNNKGDAVRGPARYTTLEWTDCIIAGNTSNALPSAKPLPHTAPTASFDAPANAAIGQPVEFLDTSRAAEGGIAKRLWDFDDGAPSSDPKTAHTFARLGDHRVTLIAWDISGRGARAEREISVK